MIKAFYLLCLSAVFFFGASAQEEKTQETGAGWIKYSGNPVLGGDLGTIFDISVLKDSTGKFLMYCSWRPQKSIALSESTDGLNWSKPVVCLKYDESSNWEKDLNRPVVTMKDGIYHMWYTGQTDDQSWIGYATSTDGRIWEKKSKKPVLSPDLPWEKVAVMCPHVIWDKEEQIFKMWYSGGEQYEPDAIGYATSKDGLHWKKYPKNPIFVYSPSNLWEQRKVTACQVMKRDRDYLMFYIGFQSLECARIGMARSKDGISNWERYNGNPIISPGKGWDVTAVYKPYVVPDEKNNRWLLYYNGRNEKLEQIGVAIHEGMDLEF
ncbi:MAG: hypothetical protein AB2L20_05600 [Mangrovibacterium sp.]